MYNDSLEQHGKHLVANFEKLRANQLYVKREKCVFAQEEAHFLGHCWKRSHSAEFREALGYQGLGIVERCPLD